MMRIAPGARYDERIDNDTLLQRHVTEHIPIGQRVARVQARRDLDGDVGCDVGRRRALNFDFRYERRRHGNGAEAAVEVRSLGEVIALHGEHRASSRRPQGRTQALHGWKKSRRDDHALVCIGCATVPVVL